MTRYIGIVLGLLLLPACNKQPAPEDTTEETTTPNPNPDPPAPSVAAQPVVDVDSLPVEEEFEQQAETELTAANLVSKLDELEREIGAE